MEVKIKQVEEKNNQLRVYTECLYGEDNLGLDINKKYLHPETDKPRWEEEVKYLLENKYGKEVTKLKK